MDNSLRAGEGEDVSLVVPAVTAPSHSVLILQPAVGRIPGGGEYVDVSLFELKLVKKLNM